MSDRINLCSKLLEKYENLRYTGIDSDVTFLIDNQKIKAHRWILSFQSEFFRKLCLENDFKEKNQVEITIEADLEAFQLILQFLYTGIVELKDLTMEAMMKFLELSRRYGLKDLETELFERIFSKVTIENIHLVIRAAEILGAEKPMSLCRKYLQNYGEDFFYSEEFFELPEKAILSLLGHGENELFPATKFLAVKNYLEIHSDCDQELKEKLLKFIDLELLSNRQILKELRPLRLFDSDFLLDFLAARETDVKEIKIPCTDLVPLDQPRATNEPEPICKNKQEFYI